MSSDKTQKNCENFLRAAAFQFSGHPHSWTAAKHLFPARKKFIHLFILATGKDLHLIQNLFQEHRYHFADKVTTVLRIGDYPEAENDPNLDVGKIERSPGGFVPALQTAASLASREPSILPIIMDADVFRTKNNRYGRLDFCPPKMPLLQPNGKVVRVYQKKSGKYRPTERGCSLSPEKFHDLLLDCANIGLKFEFPMAVPIAKNNWWVDYRGEVIGQGLNGGGLRLFLTPKSLDVCSLLAHNESDYRTNVFLVRDFGKPAMMLRAICVKYDTGWGAQSTTNDKSSLKYREYLMTQVAEPLTTMGFPCRLTTARKDATKNTNRGHNDKDGYLVRLVSSHL